MTDTDMPLAGLVPVRVPDVVSEAIDGEVLLFHPALSNVHRLSATAALIWSLCDGQRDVAEIVSLLAAAYPEAADTLEGDVGRVLSDLFGSGILAFG